MPDKELETILLLSKTAPAPLDLQAGKALNWQKILKLAKRSRTAPLIYHSLNDLNLGHLVPGEILDRLREIYYANLARNLRFWKEFCDIKEVLSARQVDVLPLKGIILANILYKDPALRCIVSDIDILIKPDDRDCARAVMQGLGYKLFTADEGHLDLYVKMPFVVEAHWLFMPPALNRIEMKTIWENAKEFTVEGRRIRALSWEDTLLTFALQVRFHWMGGQLFRFCDINEILNRYGPSLDWGYIKEKSRQWRLNCPLYFSIEFCRRFFSTDSPQLPVGFLKRRLVSSVLNNDMPSLLAGNSGRLKKIKFYLAKLALFIEPADIILFLRYIFPGSFTLHGRNKDPK